jgi:protein-disulfide isomerase
VTRTHRCAASRYERRGIRGSRPEPAPPIWRSPIAIVSVVAVVGAIGLIVFVGGSRGAISASLADPPTTYAETITRGEVLGGADAPVRLDVWSDFQCPFCGQLARSYLPRLVSDFVVGGQLLIVPHDIDILGRGPGNESVAAGVAASCAADENRYWQYHDFLFWNQDGENRGAFSSARLEAMADRLQLDRGSWDGCRADARRANDIASTTSAAMATGITSTPTLVLNGVAAPGLPRTYEDLAGAIRRSLAASPNP